MPTAPHIKGIVRTATTRTPHFEEARDETSNSRRCSMRARGPDDLLLGKLGWQSETYQLVWPRPSNTKVDTRVIEMIGAIGPATISGAGY